MIRQIQKNERTAINVFSILIGRPIFSKENVGLVMVKMKIVAKIKRSVRRR